MYPSNVQCSQTIIRGPGKPKTQALLLLMHWTTSYEH